MPPPIPKSRFQTETVDGVLVVSLLDAEIVDDFTLNAVRDALNGLVADRNPARMVLNLAKVRKFSTEFLANLLGLKSRLKKVKGSMKICCVAPYLMEAVRILHLERELDVHPEEQAAVDAF